MRNYTDKSPYQLQNQCSLCSSIHDQIQYLLQLLCGISISYTAPRFNRAGVGVHSYCHIKVLPHYRNLNAVPMSSLFYCYFHCSMFT